MAESYVSTTGIGAAAAMLRRMAEGIKRAEERAAEIAAPQIQEELRRDATTKRGNIPPGIVARASGVTVLVDAPGWVHRKASELGQRKKWAAMMRDAAGAAMQEAVKP